METGKSRKTINLNYVTRGLGVCLSILMLIILATTFFLDDVSSWFYLSEWNLSEFFAQLLDFFLYFVPLVALCMLSILLTLRSKWRWPKIIFLMFVGVLVNVTLFYFGVLPDRSVVYVDFDGVGSVINGLSLLVCSLLTITLLLGEILPWSIQQGEMRQAIIELRRHSRLWVVLRIVAALMVTGYCATWSLSFVQTDAVFSVIFSLATFSMIAILSIDFIRRYQYAHVAFIGLLILFTLTIAPALFIASLSMAIRSDDQTAVWAGLINFFSYTFFPALIVVGFSFRSIRNTPKDIVPNRRIAHKASLIMYAVLGVTAIISATLAFNS